MQAVTAIRAQGDAVADQLGSAIDAVTRDFGARSDSLIERLQSGGERLSDTIVVHGDSLAVRLNDAADRLHEPSWCAARSLKTGSPDRASG